MSSRPYVLLSCAMSVDGYIDDAGPQRLLLSNDADFDRIDAVRAGYDAILVGANTLRRDNPRLLVRSAERRAQRVARGMAPSPIKVTLTNSGGLDPSYRFFTAGAATKLVYCSTPAVDKLRGRLADAATVVAAGDPLDLPTVLGDLVSRGVRRLMAEGGGTLHAQFLAAGLADELQLAVAPFFVGDGRAPRLIGAGSPWHSGNRMCLAEVRQIGDVVLLRYLLGGEPQRAEDRRWLQAAIDLSRQCAPSTTAFSVGAVIVDTEGAEMARGYSRETEPRVHAEESALRKIAPDDPRLRRATIYSALEPCSMRRSRPLACTDLILSAGIQRVVFAWREPSVFVDCQGAEKLRAAGVSVVEIDDLAEQVREVNAHLLGGREV
ncbi:MAG: dihydrofolate reductase family protein [Egibacteraceae bacterium]